MNNKILFFLENKSFICMGDSRLPPIIKVDCTSYGKPISNCKNFHKILTIEAKTFWSCVWCLYFIWLLFNLFGKLHSKTFLYFREWGQGKRSGCFPSWRNSDVLYFRKLQSNLTFWRQMAFMLGMCFLLFLWSSAHIWQVKAPLKKHRMFMLSAGTLIFLSSRTS